MIIRPHIRAGYQAAAAYLRAQGKNEATRLVEINDPNAKDLEDAFQCMWEVAKGTQATKPLFHFSINPCKDERLTDEQVKLICERYETRCRLNPEDHQRVIVEHIKEGRQHFHVFVCRVSLATGACIDPGFFVRAAIKCARALEKELGLKSPIPRRARRVRASMANLGIKPAGHYHALTQPQPQPQPHPNKHVLYGPPARRIFQPAMQLTTRQRRKQDEENIPDSEKMPFRNQALERAEHIAWAWEEGRADILAEYGIIVDFEP